MAKTIQPSNLPEDMTIERGFRGSPNLKRIGEPVEWTDERLREYAKCKADPIYFCETYMKIVHVDRGLVPFMLYEYQKEMLMAMVLNRNVILLTGRQVGKSTVTCGFILWYILFNRTKMVGLLANKGETAREIMGKITNAYQYLPKWLQQGVVENNKGLLTLENGSRVLAAATSSDNVRGYSFNCIFIDECAFVENWETFSQSVLPTVSSGETTKIILVSTPKGLNHYYRMWINAKEKRTQYIPIEVTWQQVPGRDEAWKQKMLADLNFDADKFAQEHEAEFLGSSGTLISGKALKALVHLEPIHDSESLKQYIAPIPDHKYVIVADVSKGRGLDHSAASVIDVTKMPFQQVATYYDNVTDYPDYAEILHNMAITYNQAVILVENNAGEVVCNAIYDDFEYEGLLFTEGAGNRGKQISTRNVAKNGVEKGINTTKTVKQKGCSFLKLLVEQGQLVINDWDTIQELAQFSKKGTSYEAEPGANDDLVMGLVLFGWLSDQRFFKELTDINLLDELRNRRSEEVANAFVPFGRIIDGSENLTLNPPVIEVGYDDFDRQMMSDTNDNDLEAQFNRMFG
jgi:hypothetical protein